MSFISASFCLIVWCKILFIFQIKNWSNIFFISSDSLIKLDHWVAIADWNDKNDKKEEEEKEEEEEEVNWNDEDCCHWINCKDCCHEENYYYKEDCYHEENCEDYCHD